MASQWTRHEGLLIHINNVPRDKNDKNGNADDDDILLYFCLLITVD
jgi:hypothetical protein